jgi:hypothetical protein
MAWETREGRGRYYTRSHRVNGRVVREYVGTGLVGELAAAQDAERRREQEDERAAWSDLKEDLHTVADLVDRCWENVSALTTAVLVSAGFYRHHRGEWRRRRAR